MKTYKLKTINKSGTFSAVSTFIPRGESVEIRTWIHDSYGIVPSGDDSRVVSLEEAREEYKTLKESGWERA